MTATVKAVLSSITIDQGAKVGFTEAGRHNLPDDIAQIQQSCTRSDSALSNAVVVKIGESEDRDVRAQDLVNQLIG